MTGLHPLEAVLGGLVISMISAILGAFISSRNKVGTPQCMERRASCIALIDTKLDSIEDKLDIVMKLVNASD